MDISIIIPTHNNATMLGRTLGNLCELSCDCGFDWEVVVVNNNSSDNTNEVVLSYVEHLPVKLCFEGQQGISAARNAGIRVSSGKLIVFTDDDVRPVPNWLNAFWTAYCDNPEGFFWGGPVRSDFEATQPPEALLRYAPPSVAGLDFGRQQKVVGLDDYFIGANWACPKAAIEAVGGFNVEMGLVASGDNVRVGEETDLMSRLRKIDYQGMYLPQAMNHHFVPASKATLTHIASRQEAYAYYVALKEFSGTGLRAVPRWLYRAVGQSWVAWQLKTMTRDGVIDEYIRYKINVGKLRAARDLVKAEAK